MAEYIKRETLMKFPIRRDHCDKKHANEHFINGIETVLEYAENLPAADVEPVRHGRWIPTETPFMNVYEDCSVCGYRTVWGNGYDYCPNCGAKSGAVEREAGQWSD